MSSFKQTPGNISIKMFLLSNMKAINNATIRQQQNTPTGKLHLTLALAHHRQQYVQTLI